MKINYLDLHEYSEVHEIIEFRDGCIWKTKSRGYVSNEISKELDPAKFYIGPVGMEILNKARDDGYIGNIELPEFKD